MKRAYLLLLVLLVALSAFAIAEENSATDDSSDDGAEEITDNSSDDSLISSNVAAAPIKKIFIVGHGIAISQSDPMTFMHAKAAAGVVRVKESDSSIVEKSIGVFFLDDKKYKLKNASVADSEISADIYEIDSETPAGNISVKRYEKPGRDIWAGTMTLNSTGYNVYFIGIARAFKLKEITNNMGEYCTANPEVDACKKLGACKEDPEKCKERIATFCEKNPDDVKCGFLKRVYCLKNSDDERCREHLIGLCEQNPNLAHCRIKTVNNKNFQIIKTPTELETIAEDESGTSNDNDNANEDDSGSNDDAENNEENEQENQNGLQNTQ